MLWQDVCLSVCLSHTSIVLKWLNILQISPADNPIILVFQKLQIVSKFHRGHLLWRRWIQVGYKKFAIFDRYLAVSQRRHNKSHSCYGRQI